MPSMSEERWEQKVAFAKRKASKRAESERIREINRNAKALMAALPFLRARKKTKKRLDDGGTVL